MTRTALLLGLLLWQVTSVQNGQPDAPAPQKQFFHYQRPITSPGPAPQACAELDTTIYAHASPALKDVRLYQQDQPNQAPAGLGREIPYAVTLSETAQQDSEPATIRNLGTRGSAIVFDLQMPPRPYSDILLDLDAHNFLATATVTGTKGVGAGTELGQFTLFDLSAQRLARSTTLTLQESSLPTLHVAITLSPAPGSPTIRITPQLVRGAIVPPSREGQTIFTTIASAIPAQSGRITSAAFIIPTHVPIERLSIDLPPTFKANFSRDLRITAEAIAQPHPSQPETPPTSDQQPSPETISGTIFRVHTTQANREINDQQLSLPAAIGANLQTPARLLVQIENGDDPPLPITALRLEMRQRKLCFDPAAAGTSSPTLFYGDPVLAAPVYDYDRLFAPSRHAVVARLGPETPNPGFHSRQDTRSFAQRHPELLWAVLFTVVVILALVAYRSAGTIHR